VGINEGKKMSKNYKLQNTNYKQKTKGSHGLHQGSFKLQTMTAFYEKLLRGVQGGGFLEKNPPGKKKVRNG